MARTTLKQCKERAVRCGWTCVQDYQTVNGGYIEYHNGAYSLVYYYDKHKKVVSEECAERATGKIIAARNYASKAQPIFTGKEYVNRTKQASH